MKKYTIIKKTNMFSSGALARKAEELINQKSAQGYEVIDVSFGVNASHLPTVFITICK